MEGYDLVSIDPNDEDFQATCRTVGIDVYKKSVLDFEDWYQFSVYELHDIGVSVGWVWVGVERIYG
jgi:hypothetical protein